MSSRGTNWDPVVGHIGAFSEWPSHEGGMAIMLLVSTPSSDICAALHSVDALFVFHNQWGERCFPKLMHLVCLHAYLKMGWTTHSKIVLHSGSSRTFPKLRKACAIWKKRKQFAEKNIPCLEWDGVELFVIRCSGNSKCGRFLIGQEHSRDLQRSAYWGDTFWPVKQRIWAFVSPYKSALVL